MSKEKVERREAWEAMARLSAEPVAFYGEESLGAPAAASAAFNALFALDPPGFEELFPPELDEAGALSFIPLPRQPAGHPRWARPHRERVPGGWAIRLSALRPAFAGNVASQPQKTRLHQQPSAGELLERSEQAAGLSGIEDMRFALANAALRELAGKGVGEAFGVSDLFEEQDALDFWGRAYPALASEGAWSGELGMGRARRRSMFWASLIRSAGPDGRDCVSWLASDIADKKRQEREIARLAALAERGKNSVVLASPKGRVEWANQAFERLSGEQSDSSVGLLAEELFEGGWVSNGASGQRMSWEELVEAGAGEGRLKKANGERVWLHVETSAIHDPNGGVTQIALTGWDIEERRALEGRLSWRSEGLLELQAIASSQALTVDQKLAAFTRMGARHFEMSSGAVMRLEGRQLIATSCWSEDGFGAPNGEAFPIEQTCCSKVLERGAPVCFGAPEEGGMSDHPAIASSGAQSYIGAPLRVGGEIYGALAFASPHRRAPMGAWELAMISYLAETVSSLLSAKLSESRLEALVERRSAELISSNAELRLAMERLTQARDEVIKSERLAALGSLVAGVAHDLASPIGNSRLVADTIEQSAREFAQKISGATLRRSELSAFVARLEEASGILTDSLSQAAEMVGSFKKFSADQAGERRRVFDVAQTLEQALAALRPAWRGTGRELRLSLQPGVEVDSYPGALGRVALNLAQNALTHGFGDQQGGVFSVTLSAVEGGAKVVFDDDGVGLTPEAKKRLFEPFFTTKLSSGGSGLGLSTSWALAGKLLGGELRHAPKTSPGCRFELFIPSVAPGRALDEALPDDWVDIV